MCGYDACAETTLREALELSSTGGINNILGEELKKWVRVLVFRCGCCLTMRLLDYSC